MSEHQPVVGPDGQVIDTSAAADAAKEAAMGPPHDASDEETESGADVAAMVQQPAKVMRIGSMLKQLLDEVKSAPLDEAARVRLSDIYSQSISELKDGLAPELVGELERLSLPFTEDAAPSEAELRIAQAQLVGWLEGLFHGIQAAVFAQQMAAQVQLQQMRGAPALPSLPGTPGQGEQPDGQSEVGHYL